METTLYKVCFNDGRIFKVFCANRHQKLRLGKITTELSNNIDTIEELTHGIHTIKQWEKIILTNKPI